jgi:glycosyltransferase involved in cell wall biosynthesis
VFTVGRVSRDTLEKHHQDDPALYKMLAAYGMRVRIMGGTCLLPALAGVPGIELLPAGALPVAEFYNGLDAMLYRTGVQTEPYGRVVFEAMASALPVVAGAHGGYAQYIEQGRDGLLVRTQEEALEAVRTLAAKPELCQSLGAAARAKAIALHGGQAVETLVQYYLA